TTPATSVFKQSLTAAANKTLPHLSNVMLQSLDPTTRMLYGSGLLRFNQWCDAQNIPEEERMPASDALLSSFIAHHAGSQSDSTAKNWLSALHFWHTYNGAPWLAGPMLNQTKK